MTALEPAHPTGSRPGWYADPWRVAAWRWWDGRSWTAHVSGPAAVAPVGAGGRRPRLPAWLSLPVLFSAVLVVPAVIFLAVIEPVAVALALVPPCFLLPTFRWLDRIEPEPRASRVHALAWGATVAVVVSVIVSSIVEVAVGPAVAMVVSAPLIEETMKGLGVLWAVRRLEVDGVMDGIVYAGWVAIGFAVIENMVYFDTASGDGSLVAVFVVRGLFTPFLHPLFTAWTGLAIGRAVAAGRPVWPSVLWGWALAVATHALWNGSLLSAEAYGGVLVIIALVVFLALFVAAAVAVVRVRSAERRSFLALVPMLAQRHGIDPQQVQVFCDWRQLLATRRALPRNRRRSFDAVHGALARLAALHSRSGPLDPVDEERLAHQLETAWAMALAG